MANITKSANPERSWYTQLKLGNQAIAQQLWQRYHSRLLKLVQKQLDGQLQPFADEDDIVASAFKSFFHAVQQRGLARLNSDDDLWHLLVLFTARKSGKLKRYQQRQKRSSDVLEPDYNVEYIIGDQPTPEFALAVKQQYQRFMAQLPDQPMRDLFQLKLEGYSHAEAAQLLNCSIRTVKRRMTIIRDLLDQWDHQWDHDD